MEHPKNEKSLILIKPDGVQRSLIGEIISRLERVGLKFLALKMIIPTEEQAYQHYYKEDDWFGKMGDRVIEQRKEQGKSIDKSPIEYGKYIQKTVVDFLISGPVVAIILEGNQVCGIVRKLVGATEPLSSDVGTIRGDYTVDSYEIANLDNRSVRNLIHASEVPEDAEKEIKIWFSEDDILKYNLIQDKILYDVNLDGIKE